MRLVEVPQSMRPCQANRGADQRPILVLDLVVEFGAEPGGRDRTGIPADRRVRLRLLDRGELGRGEFLAAGLEGGFAALVDAALHLLDQDRQACFPTAPRLPVRLLADADIMVL